jgi:hypothetical protein
MSGQGGGFKRVSCTWGGYGADPSVDDFTSDLNL